MQTHVLKTPDAKTRLVAYKTLVCSKPWVYMPILT